MYGVCVESSHQKGMGHLFRMLNFVDYLRHKGASFIVFVNDDFVARKILRERDVNYEVVNLAESKNDWESQFINEYDIEIWIDDRLDTSDRHARNVKNNGIKLVTFDDRGSGAGHADLNICALALDSPEVLAGKRVLRGAEYLILNQEIPGHRLLREKLEHIVVTMGGSDTHGLTVKVVEIVREFGVSATVIIGPSFQHKKELMRVVDDSVAIRENVSSLIKELCKYDLAITAGGITPFEANACGLPCLIVASEEHEIRIGKYLDALGSSKYLGFRDDLFKKEFTLDVDIKEMSKRGLNGIRLDGLNNVFREISRL